MKNKQLLIIILSVFGIVALVSGITYSYLTFRKEQTDGENIISTVKCLTIKLTNEQNDIKLDKAFPISDEDGKELEPYTFTVKNECSDNLKISISLEDITELAYPKVSIDKIKVYLEGDNGSLNTLSSFKESNHYLAETEEISHILAEKVIFANGSTNYSLRLWIDETATDEQMNRQYKGKIVVTAAPFKTNISEFAYTGSYQEFVAPETTDYQIELWGAQGGTSILGSAWAPGSGAYTRGTIKLTAGDKLYIYVGEQGKSGTKGTNSPITYGQGGAATFNGGGAGGKGGGNTSNSAQQPSNYAGGASGGGATDIRLVSGDWNNAESLSSRIMVAGGGGGGSLVTSSSQLKPTTYYGNGGGLIGENGRTMTGGEGGLVKLAGAGATQITGYQFGIGGTGDKYGGVSACSGHSGGGGGYYGGGGATNSGASCYIIGGGGGSSFISGHTGCVAITSSSDTTPKTDCSTGTLNNSCSIHYSGKYFIDTLMIDGADYTWTNAKASTVGTNLMPNPTNKGETYTSGQGNIGNGYARITY